MTQSLRSIVIGTCCIAFAWALNGCSSEDAGQTLTVKLDSTSTLVMTRSGAGVFDDPATASVDESTPDEYQGSASLAAKVVYKGKKVLVYRWTYTVPANLVVTSTPSSEKFTLDAQAQSPHAVPLSSGRGSITLEVYEKDGSQSASASTALEVIVGFAG
jgi:hypothetical protein